MDMCLHCQEVIEDVFLVPVRVEINGKWQGATLHRKCWEPWKKNQETGEANAESS